MIRSGEIYKKIGVTRGPYLEVMDVHEYTMRVRPVGKRNSTQVMCSDFNLSNYLLVTGDELSKCQGEIYGRK